MKVFELKEALEGVPEDADVRLAMQPAWPFEYSISDVVPITNEGADEIEAIYLTEGSQLGYLPDNVTEAIGW